MIILGFKTKNHEQSNLLVTTIMRNRKRKVYGVSFSIQFKCEKIRTGITANTTF